jgi:hypothetical protein
MKWCTLIDVVVGLQLMHLHNTIEKEAKPVKQSSVGDLEISGHVDLCLVVECLTSLQ